MMNNKVAIIISMILALISCIILGFYIAICIIDFSSSRILSVISVSLVALSMTIQVVIYIIDRGAQQ